MESTISPSMRGAYTPLAIHTQPQPNDALRSSPNPGTRLHTDSPNGLILHAYDSAALQRQAKKQAKTSFPACR
jgi:hypothetical protein